MSISEEDTDSLESYAKHAQTIAGIASTRWGRFEVSILALSLVTTGSLWGLVSDLLPTATLWVGAVLATITAFLSAFSKFTNYHAIMGKALRLNADINELLGRIRAKPDMSQEQFWPAFHKLKTKLQHLEVESGYERQRNSIAAQHL